MELTAPPPMSIPSLVTVVIGLINELQRKNNTMINYYILPSPIPSEIGDYEPRLKILRSRVINISQLSVIHLPNLIDDALALMGSYLLPNITQLTVASMGIQKLFIEHYDRRLEQSLPYNTIVETLQHYEQAVHQFIGLQMSNPRRQLAENYVPPSSSTSPSLCRGAIAFLNDRDHGKASSVPLGDLLPQHRGRLADKGGLMLYWECPVCAFRVPFHASHSTNLNINQTDEILIEDDVENIAYRSAWLAKCHIYHPRSERPVLPPPLSPQSSHPRYQEAEPLSPRPSSTRRPSAPKRVSFTRRKSSSNSTVTLTTNLTRIVTRSPPAPSRSPFHHTHHHNHAPKPNSKSKMKPKKFSLEPTGPSGLRYFCPFCIAKGKPLVGAQPPRLSDSSSSSSSSEDDDAENHRNATCFEDNKEFMEHIEDRHAKDRPVNLLLSKLKVAIHGEMAPGPQSRAGRWDLDFR